MNKRKYIVKFQAHDENELVCAINVEHAKIIAQHKRIQMGEVDISVKSIEEIKPYVVKVDKYEITRLDNELTITIGNEYFNTNNGAEIIIFELVKRIEELETKNVSCQSEKTLTCSSSVMRNFLDKV